MLLGITATGKVVLILVAATFIAFALVTAMIVPRRRPGFPGDKLRVYLAACGLLFAAQIAAVAWVTGTQEVEAKAAETSTATPTVPAPTTPATTAPTPTTPSGEQGDAAAGKKVFSSAGVRAVIR